MGSKIIEIFNKIAYNVLSALYQPFWAAVLLAFLTMFLYLYGKEHGWKKNSFIRNMFGTWWRAFKSSSNFRRTFLLAFYTAMILLRTVLNREIEYSCAVTPQVRQTGNRLSGLAGTAYASLFT